MSSAEIDRQLIVARAGKLGKLVELVLQVKDLFLQIYDVSGAQIGEFYLVCGDIKLAAQDSLPNAQPPSFDHRPSIRRHPLQQPRRDQSLLRWGERDHKGIK